MTDVLKFFDALHSGPTWRAWRVFVAATYGKPLDDKDLEIFRQHTGRQRPDPAGYPEAVAIVGVQSGKSSVVATLADHAALTGERGTHALMIAQDYRGALRSLLRYARSPFERLAPFRAEIVRETADTTELKNGVSLSAYPCRPAAIRGLRACVVAIDEIAFFTATDGRPTDTEMLRVARGRVATTGGKVIILSSPYGQSGALYELHRKHFGREDSRVLIWQATAPQMNPTLPADYLERMAQDDPDAYRSEVLGEFRAGVSTFLDPDALADVVDDGIRERLPESDITYHGYVDSSSGSGKDSFAIGISHRDGELAVLDVCRAWRPPFNPSGVIAEAAVLFRTYRIATVSGDRYAPGFVSEGFRQHGITYKASKRTTSEVYLELLPLVNAGAAVLLDEPNLLRELRGLERKRGTAGRDKVDHRRGEHDDRAVAAAGSVVNACAPKKRSWGVVLDRAEIPKAAREAGVSTTTDLLEWKREQAMMEQSLTAIESHDLEWLTLDDALAQAVRRESAMNE